LTDEAWAKIEPLIPMGRRGAKPGNNRPVISGILHVLTYERRSSNSPMEYGPNTVIYNRFSRWSKSRHLAGDSPTDQTFGASRVVFRRQHDKQSPLLRRRRKREAREQAIGRGLGGRTTQIHAVTDAAGRRIAFDLSAGQAGDIRFALPLLRNLWAPAHPIGRYRLRQRCLPSAPDRT
jgi:transposase